MVFLHGYLENVKMWDFCIPEISKTNRIIAIDLLGHGQSDSIGYIHTMEDQAKMVNEVLVHLKIDSATIIGHSMGGYIALAFSELFPKSIKSLVLVNSTSYSDSLERQKNRDRAVKMVKKDFASFVRLSIANLFSEANREKLINEIEIAKSEALKTPLQGIIAAQEGMKIRTDRSEFLKTLQIPILLVLSLKDPVLDYSQNIKQIENTIIKLATLTDGHMSHIENRVELLDLLINFIKQ